MYGFVKVKNKGKHYKVNMQAFVYSSNVQNMPRNDMI